MICRKCKKELPDDAPYCCWCGTKQETEPRTAAKRANNTGSVYRRGRSWYARVTVGYKTVNGRVVQVRKAKGGYKTRTEALNACATLCDLPKERPVMTIAYYWDVYANGELKKISTDKQRAYRIAYEKMAALHNTPISQLSVQDLRQIVEDKAKTYYPARDMKVVLSHLFELASVDGEANKDLPSYILLPKLEESAREPFTDLEQAALWKSYESGSADASIPLIMIYTGMMTGEMRRLSVDMIDLSARQINGVGLKTHVRKASAVFVPDAIVPLLEYWMERAVDGKLFAIREMDFYARYYAALEAAGVRKLTPYSCRHTTATALAINENVAPQTVRKIMRWSTTRMLDRYAHPSAEDAHAAINLIGKNTENA